MSLFDKLFSGGISQVVDSAGNIIDKFKLSPKQKQDFKIEMESLLQKQESEIEETYRKEVDAKMQIMTAELSQGDNYTKRARPSVIYAGLIFIFIIHVLLPLIGYLTHKTLPVIKLPEEFWWAWGSVVSVYGIGRTVEKSGVRNKVTNAITGSGAFRINDKEAKG